ncbi:AAA family ATPase [Natronomonas sp. EA1]|uniref:AAA family ATPase n=1 Tax=Natronomonas sp. EA1 TaxID=3421655 RepID=UPI003EC0D4D1
MRVIGTVGMPGSGKGEAARLARERGIPVITMGDVIRQECRDRGLDPAEHHGEIAQALRDEDGPLAIAKRSLPLIREAVEEHDTVLVDGLRSDDEVECFEEAFGEEFTLVAITAPFEVRAERIDARGRDNTAAETLRERDDRELGFGMGRAIEAADVEIENTESLAAFRQRITEVLE